MSDFMIVEYSLQTTYFDRSMLLSYMLAYSMPLSYKWFFSREKKKTMMLAVSESMSVDRLELGDLDEDRLGVEDRGTRVGL